MRRLIGRLAGGEGGFAMIPTIGIMVTCGLLALAAFTSAMGDLPLAKGDQGRKSSLDAAQAGVAWYAAKLKADPDYWTKCGAVPDPDGGSARPPVSGTPIRPGQADTRAWRAITPGSTLQFTVELLPARGGSCSTSDPAGTMLDNNRLRIRVTGRDTTTGKKRTLVATFRRPSFLNYVYFTDYEVIDPDADGVSSTTVTNCGKYWRDARTSSGAVGRQGCSEIQWGSGDVVAGPIHTNDILNINGSPTFGRSAKGDRIETTDPAGARSSGTNGAKYLGVKLFGIDALQLPPNDSELATLTNGNLFFSGPTQIQLQRGSLRYRSIAGSLGPWKTTAYPANGLIFVQPGTGTCTATTVYSKYNIADPRYVGCADAYVSGTYDQSLTIAAANDVVIAGDLRRAGTSELLGLIGNNYVRVMNPVTFDLSTPSTCSQNDDSTNASNTLPYALRDVGDSSMRFPLTTPTIQAGILAINHSFLVDNYACGSSLGTLNVKGAIAQKYRGPVATTSGSSTYLTGYRKNYQYDDLLSYREPPNFLDPLKAAWIFMRQVEQVPAS